MPRTCTLCRHPDRAQIEAELLRGVPLRTIAVRYRVSASALGRHKANDMLISDERGSRVSWSIEMLRDPAKSMAERGALVDALLDRLLEPLWKREYAGQAGHVDWNTVIRLLRLVQLDDLAVLRMSGQLRAPDAEPNVQFILTEEYSVLKGMIEAKLLEMAGGDSQKLAQAHLMLADALDPDGADQPVADQVEQECADPGSPSRVGSNRMLDTLNVDDMEEFE